MPITPDITEADRILDELDRLARHSDSNASFWNKLLSSLRSLVRAEAASLVLQLQSHAMVIAQQGSPNFEHIAALEESSQRDSGAECWWGVLNGASWFAVPIRSINLDRGWLLLHFAAPLHPSSIDGLQALVRAFADIYSTATIAHRDARFQLQSQRMEHALKSLLGADSQESLRQVLVDQVQLLSNAARVSLSHIHPESASRSRLLACSGVHQIDATSPTVQALVRMAWQAAVEGRPKMSMAANSSGQDALRSEKTGEVGLIENYLAMPLESRTVSNATSHWLILEWPESESMAEAFPELPLSFGLVQPVWIQQSRWCTLPTWIRERAARAVLPTRSPLWARWFRPVLVVLLLIALVWAALRPVPMTIEATALLEPVNQRSIHASVDGYLTELLATDRQPVTVGQKLAQLRSPSLELQLEEVLGQIRSMAEKRNGLQVAINQLSPSSSDSVSNQTRLSTELLVLDTQEKHAREKLEFLKREQDRLVLTSPIEGVMLCRESQRELENRPVKRGDRLFQVVDLSGPSQLMIQVADRDTHYVGTEYARNHGVIDYVFDSLPEERFQGTVTELANRVDNRFGDGNYQTVYADVDPRQGTRVRIGATARVSFVCGQQPFWFVWSRPLVEFLQKRYLLFTHSPDNSLEQEFASP